MYQDIPQLVDGFKIVYPDYFAYLKRGMFITFGQLPNN